jgi:hypothetical protein
MFAVRWQIWAKLAILLALAAGFVYLLASGRVGYCWFVVGLFTIWNFGLQSRRKKPTTAQIALQALFAAAAFALGASEIVRSLPISLLALGLMLAAVLSLLLRRQDARQH